MVDTSPFVIRELTGEQREIQLTGRALPYRPFTLRGTQRVELTWLPGAPEATDTVLGGTEAPTTIRGYWKSKFLGQQGAGVAPFLLDNAPVLTTRNAIRIMDEIRQSGQKVEVQWLDVLRHGFLKEFEQSWNNSEDCEWTMDFEWSSRGIVTQPAVFITDVEIGGAFSVLQEQMAKLDEIGTPNFNLLDKFLATIQGFQQKIQEGIDNVEDTIINFTNKVLSTVRATRGIIATLRGIENEASLMVAFLSSSASGAINGARPVQDQGYSEVLSAQLYAEELRAWAYFMRGIAIQNRTQMQSQISTDVLATYIARAGEDLRDVSARFYSTPFEWRRIMVFNDLNSIELSSGQVVLVPKLNPNDAGQQGPGI
jgi:nucleoid-associated protein YgaU